MADVFHSDPTETSLDPVLTQATMGPSPQEEKNAAMARDRAIRDRLAKAEAAGPTSRQRTQSETIDLSMLTRRLGNPYSTRWIPFEQRREMTTDLMLAFGWWMTVSPLARAEWSIECPNAQLAAAVDEALRPVIAADYLAFSNAMWFGHQPLVKNFKLGQLGGTYRDPQGSDPLKDIPVWNSSADALLWKPPTVLNPSHCLPTWDDDGGMNGFKFSNTPIPHFDLISAASTYGYEVIPGHVIDADRAMWITNEQMLNFGCSPPDEPVLTTTGWKAIGELDPELDRLVSFDRHKIRRGHTGRGRRLNELPGSEFEMGERPYNGDLLTIDTGVAKTRVTPNHKLTVRWSSRSERFWGVYLMRRGNWWRIGMTRLNRNNGSASVGLASRMYKEKAEAAWILGVFETKPEALFHEQLWSNEYQVPDLCFEVSPSGGKSALGQDDITKLWNSVESETGALRALEDRNLDPVLPLFQYSNGARVHGRGGRMLLWTVVAANLLPGLMEMPVDRGDDDYPEWREFTITREHYEGPVVSLEVLPHHHYVSGNGIITQNSVFGSPRTSRAYRYWWSYNFRWALADRSYENLADPAKYVYYPVDFDEFIDPDDPELENPKIQQARNVAIATGEAIRSGATVAFPGTFAEGQNGQPSTHRKWEAGYFETKNNFSDLDATFKILDVLKLRAWFSPEQAFVEGCLKKDTPILCPRDHAKYPYGVPINQVRPGQLLWSYNEQRERFELWPVKDVYPTKTDLVGKVTLDDGTEIVGTFDHPFLTRDGQWREMQQLCPGDSLMPLYEKSTDTLYNGSPCNADDFEPWVGVGRLGGFVPEFRAVGDHYGWTKRGIDAVIHHKDERHANSSIDNLECLTSSDHAIGHMQSPERIAFLRAEGTAAIERLKGSMTAEEWRAYCSARVGKAWQNGRELSKWKDKTCDQCGAMFAPTSARQKYCDDHSPKKQQRANAFKGRIKGPRPYQLKVCLECNMEFRPTSGVQKYCAECQEARRRPKYRNQGLAPTNHKVVSIEFCGIEEVWDIEMEAPAHCRNFVAAGVVVHNTGGRTSGGSAGGTGGARMASELGQVHEESQQLLLAEYDAQINDHKIPQFIAANFPELIGTPCKKTSRALGVLDEQTLSQVLTLVGQVRGEVLPVDMRALLTQMRVPLLSEDQWKKEMKNIQEMAAVMQPPQQEPTRVGTQGYNAGVMKGDSGKNLYYQPQQRIVLAESDGFMNELPDTPHFQDAGVRSALVRLRRAAKDRYEGQYKSFADFLESQATLHLAQNDQQQQQGIREDQAGSAATAIISLWAASHAPGAVGAPSVVVTEPGSFAEQAAQLVAKIAIAGGKSALKGARLDAEDFGAGALEPWVNDRVKFALDSIDSTVRDEAGSWLKDQLQESIDPHTVAVAARKHFEDFPTTHANRVARTESVQAFNQGTLEAFSRAGVSQVQAHDASDGTDHLTDAECQKRNGRVYSVQDAMDAPTHPNDTLYWTPLGTEQLSVERVAELPSHLAQDGLNVAYDERSETLFMTEAITPDQEQGLLLLLGDQLQIR